MINYSLKGKTKLSTSTPTYYILDESNTIVFKDTNRENLLKKISDLGLVSSSTLIANANRYISENFFDGNSDKRKVLYFYMPGCPDCEAANTLLRENDLDEKFDIAYVYKYDTTDSSKVIDKDKLFANVYGITWYPSFLVLTGSDYRLVGETPAENLIAELSNLCHSHNGAWRHLLIAPAQAFPDGAAPCSDWHIPSESVPRKVR